MSSLHQAISHIRLPSTSAKCSVPKYVTGRGCRVNTTRPTVNASRYKGGSSGLVKYFLHRKISKEKKILLITS